MTLVSNNLQEKITLLKKANDSHLTTDTYYTYIDWRNLWSMHQNFLETQKKFNWGINRKELVKDLSYSAMNIRGYSGIENVIKVYKKSCPLIHPRRNGTPWWAYGLETQKQQARKLRRSAQRAQKRGTTNEASVGEKSSRELKNNPMHTYQKDKSVDTVTHKFINRIRKTLDKNQFTLRTMLDIRQN